MNDTYRRTSQQRNTARRRQDDLAGSFRRGKKRSYQTGRNRKSRTMIRRGDERRAPGRRAAPPSGGRGRAPRGRVAPRRPAEKIQIPQLAEDAIRIIMLGGVEEVGRNMVAVEYGDDIIVIDCGIQFKGEETPGIDYILPNTRYLEERKDKIKALFITHGHLDHIGGVPYLITKLGNPPIYTRELTALMIQKRQEEFPHLPRLDIRTVEKEDRIKAGRLTVRFFAVTHTIPDSLGLMIDTPCGTIVHTGDVKIDHKNGKPTNAEEAAFAHFKKENVLLLLADSTNVWKPGWSIPESTVFKNFEEIIKSAKGRLIVGTFASQIERIAKIIEIAERHGKKIIVDGRSMRTNVAIAQEAGVLKPQKGTIVPIEEMGDYPPEKLIVLVTGAQGDEFAVLMRVANKNHKFLALKETDTVVLSSSIIPGNELAVQKLKDNLSRQGANIVHYQVSDVHASGHANQEEVRWMHQKIRPKFFMPIHGYHYMLRVHENLAKELGMTKEQIIVPDNGTIAEIREGCKTFARLKETAPKGLVLVDGFSVGDMQEVVLRDRQMLAQDGMFVVVVTLDVNSGKLRKSPDLISRGFVYLRESQELLKETRDLIRKTTEQSTAGMRPINFDYLKDLLADSISRHLFLKTNKRPIVIPVILGV